ncbi:MAG: hypothetical protein QXR57_03890 [Metallosphaera sp.]|nr:hypothetical protein [Metallosphaera cuprina]
MDSTIDLNDITCSSDPLEAIEFLKGRDVVFTISKDSPFFIFIKNKYTINIISRKGDTIYFTIRSDG